LIETEEERELFKKGEKNYQAKKSLRTRSLLAKAPDSEESNLIHSLWTKEMSYLSACETTISPGSSLTQRRP
jgi:acyl-coenzyme A thioesterase 9